MITRTYQHITESIRRSHRVARFVDQFYAGRIADNYTRFALAA